MNLSERDRELHAFLYFSEEQALVGDGPLSGQTVALKDNLCVKGWPTTAGSRILENFVPPYTATVVERLRAAGARLLGKTNLDEFAMGSSTENSAYGVTRNPWDLERVPGGSSGGSAAAVAAGLCDLALGTDTGGSIRQPAAFCGITGLKPTYGRVSRYGLIAYGSSLDQIGPMAYSAEDCARLLQVIAGPDPLDSTCFQEASPDFSAQMKSDCKGLRLGWDPALIKDLAPEMRAAFEAGLQVYRELGLQLVEVSLPHIEYSLPAYYLIATAEASSNLARYDGVRYGHRAQGAKDVASMMSKTRSEGFGAEVKRRIMLGTYALSSGYYDAYYAQAQKMRTLLRQDFQKVFTAADAFALPTTPAPAFKIGEKSQDPLAMYLSDVYTVVANLTGLPALSHPGGFLGELPVGLQLMAPAWQEGRLLQLAHHFQQRTSFHQKRPQAAVV
ncbi:MAG: Asp-tRNA(Asn)/Glu-tRNA(Gln) amidotransferase subunit GatA [Candidatus Eremiobacteraeota bacterium]|nr:Asp-tRNA(Asn)/Glu-tRNA(Gln) amidotransferase subunit GatA [Candidatus Eremiobacteraeota bacterium]